MKSIKQLMKKDDMHLVVNGSAQRATLFNRNGEKQWTIPARTWGQHENWRQPNGDTPPGLYVAGVLYDTAGEAAYGPYCLDMIDLEDQETGNGRAGISLHGGGSSLPDPFAPYQGWRNTHGCVRVQNKDLTDKVVPVYRRVTAAGGRLYITVIL